MPDRIHHLAVIGAGIIGQGLTTGLIAAGVYSPSEITVADLDKERLETFANAAGVSSAGNVEAASRSETIILAVKPNIILGVLEEISGYVGREQLVISVAAGVKIDDIGAKLKSGVPVIRAMPNTPCTIGAGAVAFSRGKHCQEIHTDRAGAIFSAVGKVIEVPERLLDAVTGLSGSGPAYIYVAIEAMADAGVAEGLTRDQAMLLAAQTVLGAAKMVLETGKSPSELRNAVASPGGTTIAGLVALERAGFRAAVLDAVEAATLRAKELSRPD